MVNVSHCLVDTLENAWFLDLNVEETFSGPFKGSILLDSILCLTEKATKHVAFFEDLSGFFLNDFCCHGCGQQGIRYKVNLKLGRGGVRCMGKLHRYPKINLWINIIICQLLVKHVLLPFRSLYFLYISLWGAGIIFWNFPAFLIVF